MSYNIIVLAKQVPDTRNVGKDAMKEDGTINRAALPAIFNPEDLNALEQALRIKDANPGTTVTILTMGLPRAAEVIREAMYRGADAGIVLTDRVLGGADTLATSYSLARAVNKFGKYDLILGGRQAIDGDTAQVGPQIAEKLGLPQITYAEEILDITPENITVKRRLENIALAAPLRCDRQRIGCRMPSAQCNASAEIQIRRLHIRESQTERRSSGSSRKARISQYSRMERCLRGG